MPELPEVETIRRQLTALLPFKIEEQSCSKFLNKILKEKTHSPQGQSIIRIERYGKFLIFHLADHNIILSHLGMSGSWRMSVAPLSEKHVHLQFKGPRGHLSYVDPRRFGRLYYVTLKRCHEILAKLGRDISQDNFDSSYLKTVLKSKQESIIKPLLLDQKLFAGIGNYIACELLARAGIDPRRKVKSLTSKELEQIIKGLHSVLEGSIKHQGLTFSGGYKDTTGSAGKGLENLVVFHQMICGLCHKRKIERIIQQGRSTFFCPDCQK